MLRKLGVALLFMVVVTAPQAHAAKGSMTLGVNGGMLIPSGDFADGFKTGWFGAVSGDYGVNDKCSVGLEVGMSGTKHEDDGTNAALVYPGLTGTIKDQATIMPILLRGKYMFPTSAEKVHPYVVLGVGMYNFKEKFETDNFSEEPSDTKFGGRGGVGVTYMASPQVGIGVEGSYHYISTDVKSTTFMTITAGVSIPLGAK